MTTHPRPHARVHARHATGAEEDTPHISQPHAEQDSDPYRMQDPHPTVTTVTIVTAQPESDGPAGRAFGPQRPGRVQRHLSTLPVKHTRNQ